MNGFIEESYYSNINPQARSSDQNKKVQHDMQTLNESEDFLTDKLSGEEKKRIFNTSMYGHLSTENPSSIASSPASTSVHNSLSIPSSH